MNIRWIYESGLALKAVSSSSEYLAEFSGSHNISTKESLRDVVTEADFHIEKSIKTLLLQSDYPFIGEEEISQNPVNLPHKTPFWAVDPIDGTANFASGLPYYAISVGLCHNDQFLVGAVSLPALKELYFTHGNQGAFFNGRPIKASNSPLEESLVAASFSGTKGDSSFRKLQYEFFALINDSSRGALRLGSAAANICFVASGRLQGAYGFEAEIWDVAGSLAIATQAGCRIFIQPGTTSTRVNYIVGGEAVTDKILSMAIKKEIIKK